MSESHRPHPPAMRLLLLALAVTLTAGYSSRPGVLFSQRSTYRYRYEVEMLIRKDRDLPLAKAGIKLTSDVLISSPSNSTVIVKFHNTSIYDSNNYHGPKWVKADQLSQVLASDFERTIKFDYKSGKVDKILVPSKSSLFVENIKKAMINTLQMTLKSDQAFYTLQEVGSQGTCRTTYILDKSLPNKGLKVTKTRNLRECMNPVFKSSGLSYSESCPECVATAKAITGSDSYTYLLNHTGSGYLIASMRSKEQIIFNPLFDVKGGTIMEADQWLTLEEIKEHQILPSPGPYLPTSQEYKFGSEGESFPFLLKNLDTAEAQAIEVLKRLADNTTQNDPLDFLKLIRLLQASPREMMESLWTKFSHLSNYRRVLRDAIPQDHSLKALKFIKDKFVAGNLTASEAAQMLAVSLQVVNSERLEALLVVKSLLEEPKIIEQDLVRKVSTLGVGSFIYRCSKNIKPCSSSGVLNMLHEMLNKAILVSDSKTISLAIKTLANAAQPPSVRVIERLLPGFGHICGILEPQVIVDAVLALRRFSKVVPREIQQISLRLLLNKQLLPEVRSAAMIALFDANPSMGVVNNVAIYMRTESNLQVAHFAYTLIKSLSLSTMPDRHLLAQACKHGLGIIRNRPFPLIHRGFLSSAFSRSLYSSSSKIGSAIFAYGIKNELSPFAKTTILRLEVLLASLRATPLEVVVRANALLENMLKVTDGSASRAEKMIKIARILSGADPQLMRRLESVISLKPWDQEVIYFDPLESLAEFKARRPARELITQALREIQQGYSGRASKSLLPIDAFHTLATSGGLALSINDVSVLTSSASLDVKGGPVPPLSDDSQIQQLENSNITVKAVAQLSVEFHNIFAVGILSNHIEAQLQTHSKVAINIPLSVEATVDMSQKKVTIKQREMEYKQLLSLYTETMSTTATSMDQHWYALPLIEPPPHKEELSSVSTPSAKHIFGSPESVVTADMPTKVEKHDSIPDVKKGVVKLCDIPNGFIELEYETRSTSTDKRCMSCLVCGTHGIVISVVKDVNSIKEAEISIALGKEAKNIMTAFNQVEETETLEDTNVLMKLQKILTPGLKNQTSSSSSSESYSGESSRSSMSQSSSSSESLESSSSSSEISRQTPHGISADHGASMHMDSSENFDPKSLDSESPLVVVCVRIFRVNDNPILIGAFFYKTQSTVHISVKKVSGNYRWGMDITGYQLRGDKTRVDVKWGTRNQYKVGITADTTVLHEKPADRAIIAWLNVPRYFAIIGEQIRKILSEEAHKWGWHYEEAANRPRMATIYFVHESPNERVLVVSAPKWNLLSGIIDLPLTKLIREAYVELKASEGSLGNKMLHMISNANAAKCTLAQDTVVTFNSRQYKSELPHICSQVLAQDCTAERKFLVQLKKDLILNQNDINVLVADIDVSIHQRGNAIGVTVNGIEIPVSNLPYQHPTGTIRIAQKDQGIALFAARHGLNEVFLDLNGLQIKIPDWMRGQTCGMCGRGDGEVIEEYHTPNGRLATNALSFTQSWVVPGTGCSDVSKCYLATQSVKLDRQISLNGQESKCYSVEPVLRCQPGCTPVRTTTVEVGYHCVPAEASVNRAESLSSIFKKSVDVTEKAVAHLACRCSSQCA